MYEIINKEKIAPDFFRFEVNAPRISAKAKTGEFVILRVDEKGERIPLTICDFDSEREIIVLIFQVVGRTTKKMSSLKEGNYIKNILGPLGNPSKISTEKNVICIGGGAGIAMIFPLIKALKEKDNTVISVIGAKNKSLVILKEEIEGISNEFFVTTDDGSLGEEGFVTDELSRILRGRKNIDKIFAVGPVIMMEKVAEICCPQNIELTVSLNSIMVDGTGMCGGCRVTVGGETKFTCVDGPEFDGCKVDFKELKARNNRFLEEEENSNCKLKSEYEDE